MLARLLVRLAAPAGILARWVMRWGAGIFGALLVTVGIWSVYRPAGLVAAGAFLLALDRRTP